MITKRSITGKGLWILLFLSLGLVGCGQKPEAFLLAANEDRPQDKGAVSATLSPTVPACPAPTIEEGEPELLYVDVCGAVVYPGVYTLEEGSRVFAAIDAAGGFTADAATTTLNQALPLEDGAQIYVPTLEETLAGFPTDSHADSFSPLSSQGLGGAASPQEGKVDINHADASQIEQIKGIGPSKAKAIVEYRDTKGSFTCPEDLLNVSGIGEGTLEKIKEQILVN